LSSDAPSATAVAESWLFLFMILFFSRRPLNHQKQGNHNIYLKCKPPRRNPQVID
jgi:hypothetical protein